MKQVKKVLSKSLMISVGSMMKYQMHGAPGVLRAEEVYPKDPEKVVEKEQNEEKERVFVPSTRCSIKVKEKPKVSQKDNKARTRIHSLLTGQKEKESTRPSSRPRKDKQGKAIPQKRQASLNPAPMTANGSNLLILTS